MKLLAGVLVALAITACGGARVPGTNVADNDMGNNVHCYYYGTLSCVQLK